MLTQMFLKVTSYSCFGKTQIVNEFFVTEPSLQSTRSPPQLVKVPGTPSWSAVLHLLVTILSRADGPRVSSEKIGNDNRMLLSTEKLQVDINLFHLTMLI